MPPMEIHFKRPQTGFLVLTVPGAAMPVYFEQRHEPEEGPDTWSVIVGCDRVIEGLYECPQVLGFNPMEKPPEWTLGAPKGWIWRLDVKRAIQERCVS